MVTEQSKFRRRIKPLLFLRNFKKNNKRMRLVVKGLEEKVIKSDTCSSCENTYILTLSDVKYTVGPESDGTITWICINCDAMNYTEVCQHVMADVKRYWKVRSRVLATQKKKRKLRNTDDGED
jgi:hypothetical protein